MSFKSFSELSRENAPAVAARLSQAGVQARSIENPNTPLTGRELVKAFGEIETSTGVVMSPEAALSHPDVYACVRIVSEYVAMLPILLYKRVKNDAGDKILKQLAPEHPAFFLLSELPNPEMTAVEVIEAMVGHVLLRGNAYAHVVRDNAGRVKEIWPLRPDRVWVYRKLGETGEMLPGGDLEYIYTPYAGTPIRFDEDEIWHVKGLSTDGLLGYAPVQLQAEAMGAAVATEKYAGRFFANDGRPGGILVHPGSLSDKAYERIRNSVNEAHRGFGNAHKTMILEEGISWQQVGLSPDDAQFLQTRQFNTGEIGRIFRVSGRLLNDERHPSRLSAEDATAEDIRNMVLPWTRRFELTVKRDILRLQSDRPYFAKFDLTAVQRASLAARTAFYQAGRSNGFLSANDVLIAEGMNPIGPEGDHYMVPLNMIPATAIQDKIDAGDYIANKPGDNNDDDPDAVKAPASTAKGPASLDPSKGSDNNAGEPATEKRSLGEAQAQSIAQRAKLREAFAPLFADAVTRVLKRERRDVMEAAAKAFKRSAADFETWLEGFYADGGAHATFTREVMAAPVKTYIRSISGVAAGEIGSTAPNLDAFSDSYVEAYAQRHAAFSRADILAAFGDSRSKRDDTDDGDGALAALGELFDRMLATRPAETGGYEASRADGAAARATYKAGGRSQITWTGGGCKFCSQLNGRTVSVDANFVDAGQQIHSGDESADMHIGGNVGHPPLHRGCNDCTIVAADSDRAQGSDTERRSQDTTGRALELATRALEIVSRRDQATPVVNIDHHTHIEPGAIHSEHHSHIDRGALNVEPAKVDVAFNMPKPGGVSVLYDDEGNPVRVMPD